MAGPNSLEDLQELVNPVIQFFDGLVVTYHGELGDAESKFLEENKKEGKIIYLPYCQRHDFSRNAYLFCGPMKNGDWCLQIDVLERLGVQFAQKLPTFIKDCKHHNLNGIWYYGKPFLFEYHESLVYRGSPHEGMVRQDGNMAAIDYSQAEPDEGKVRLNVRPLKRPDLFHWVGHYCKYMLFPFGSNHSLLGLDERYYQNEMQVGFQTRETARLAFIKELEKRGFERTVKGVIEMLSGELDETLKTFLRTEKVWQDVYRYYVLNDRTVIDEHKWSSMIEIK